MKTCEVSLPEIGADPEFSSLGNYLITWSQYRKNISNLTTSKSNNDEWTDVKANSESTASIVSNLQVGNLKVWKLNYASPSKFYLCLF